MGAEVQCKCEEAKNPVPANEESYQSISQINKRLEIFALQNKLMIYPPQVRKVIENLFIFKQEQLCYVLLDLLKQNKSKEKDLLLTDIQRIDQEEFDNIFHKVEFQPVANLKKTQEEPDFCYQFTEDMKMEGQRVLEEGKVALIAFLNCFQNQNCLKETNLPSKSNPFQIFISKVQALNHKYPEKAKLILITNRNVQIHEPKDWINFVVYESQFPCFDEKGRIASYANRVIFPENSGDLISFLMHKAEIREILKEVDFVSFCDVENLVGPVISQWKLGWLVQNTRKSILAQVYSEERYRVKNGFIDLERRMGSCLMRRQFLFEINRSKSNLFIGRIQKQKMEEYNHLYFLNRNLSKLLLASHTTLTEVGEEAFEVKGYSAYCQKILGIQAEPQEEEYIQIDPQILYGDRGQIKRIIEELRNSENIGFPIVILKSDI